MRRFCNRTQNLEKHNLNSGGSGGQICSSIHGGKERKKGVDGSGMNRLQKEYQQKVEDRSYQEKTKVEKKYYLLLGILAVLRLLYFRLVFVEKMRI